MTGFTTLSGKTIPPLFYGTAWKKTASASLVALALSKGFRAIDTACQPKHYQEALVGQGIMQPPAIAREDLFLQTKFTLSAGQDPNNIPYDINARLEDQVRQSFAKSLENLQTNYLDAILMHSPARSVSDTCSVMKVFNSFKDKGQVRYIGISNIYSLPLLREICAQLPPSTVNIVQNRFYAATGYDVDIRAFCKENGIMYQSFWTLTGNPMVLSNPIVRRIAKIHGISEAGVFYRFCTQNGITVLDGTTSEEHMAEDLKIVTDDTIALSEDEMST